ncbi:GAF domain-containing protein [Cryobacterium sp. TMT1-21]|uniref:GAF domain-containing protein n=1 Tax=Cryobacterium shii TaxID=1259235 RepID=A0AAQ2HH82_9MICO|nr:MULTISPECIES: GAF domain-containing protein [Cryobacterium]TFC52578.1 GAF domain-containing protein [Cryobacterium shii]TFC82359.1 GAF domain-containing protein [Cryobacterium sp. TmT2-59]TFD13928.1 GAF domain-containing protein [Cryobacterium sp. TMT4-10]TFD16361.1 GAF domain-containing protein [Cryobacterium sp. TMT1-21]TFD27951.1 GAF domain-containing protein [Cryobacterium sp. TMT2-23]
MPQHEITAPVATPFTRPEPSANQSDARLRRLLLASQAIVGQLDLLSVQRRIVEAAVDLCPALFGALATTADNGRLEPSVQVGASADAAVAGGAWAEVLGLLGTLADDPVPLRLSRWQAKPRPAGFEGEDPPMQSLLAVPVRVRGEVSGILYLIGRVPGAFDQEDEDLLCALAATAGIAIDNARLFEETQRRQRWSAASAGVSAALLTDRSDDTLALLADRFAQTADAQLVCVVVPDGIDPGADASLVVATARGPLAQQAAGLIFPVAGSLCGRVFSGGQPLLVDGGDGVRPGPDSALICGSTMVIPLGAGVPHGVLTASRPLGAARFTASDLVMASDFAEQASVALELSLGRADRARLAVLEDRGRIARDLHDLVIQRVFAAGMSIQAIGGEITDRALRLRLDEEVQALDAAIVEIRTAIFALTLPAHPDRPSLRHRVIDLLTELGPLFEQPPRVVFSGPIDLVTPADLADDLVAVIREGLTNVVRHARAGETVVSLTVVADSITIEISDDGVGRAKAAHSGGIDNLAARAGRWQGNFTLDDRAPRGTRLRWAASLVGASVTARR